MELTEEQKLVLYKIVKGVKDEKQKETILGGYAGTGKTILVSYLAKFFPDFSICAYTGKAANVLRKKGISSASTIHSLIYRAVYEYGRLLGFELIPRTELPATGFIVDEGSMVTREIYEDLKYYGFPVIYVGDHGQLEPVGSDFNIMKSPNYTLEKIHRNAGDIAQFSERLRFGYNVKNFQETEKVRITPQRHINIDDMIAADQVICAYNKTRVAFNGQIRAELGHSGTINVGERVMCLKNNRNQGLFNGMQGVVRNVYEDDYGRPLMDFDFDGFLYTGIWYDPTQFGKEKLETECFGKEYPNPFDYAYAITAHKSQGDEFGSVLAYEQKCPGWDHRRWAYTVASRAKEHLTWAYA